MPDYLTSPELAAVHYIEEYYTSNSKLPSIDELIKHVPEVDPEEAFNKPVFIKSLVSRGIDPPVGTTLKHFLRNKKSTLEAARSNLTEAQLAAIVLITDFRDRRSVPAKLKTLGVTTVQWNAWMRSPKFKAYVHKISKQNFEDSLDVAHAGLLKKVEEGDTSAIKFYMELTERWGGEASTVQNLKIVIARLVESIQRHVKDPETIRSIEQDFKLIMGASDPVRTEPVRIELSNGGI